MNEESLKKEQHKHLTESYQKMQENLGQLRTMRDQLEHEIQEALNVINKIKQDAYSCGIDITRGLDPKKLQ